MTIAAMEVCRRLGIERTLLQAWISAGWIQIDANDCVSEADDAKAQLIQDLIGPLGVNDEGVAVILDLLAQLHGLRRLLAAAFRRQREQDEAAGHAGDSQAAQR